MLFALAQDGTVPELKGGRVENHGLNVDFDGMADKMYEEIFTDEDKGVLAFGMIPKDKLDCAVEQFKIVLAQRFVAPGGHLEGLGYSPEDVAKHIKVEVVQWYEKELSHALYRAADRAGKLLV